MKRHPVEAAIDFLDELEQAQTAGGKHLTEAVRAALFGQVASSLREHLASPPPAHPLEPVLHRIAAALERSAELAESAHEVLGRNVPRMERMLSDMETAPGAVPPPPDFARAIDEALAGAPKVRAVCPHCLKPHRDHKRCADRAAKEQKREGES